MRARFQQLYIHGFKSFAEPTTLEFDEPLIALVGPNGCGKSNIVEALRWVMGESSARRLRGEEMEDVLFAGAGDDTTTHQARQSAEVALTLALHPEPNESEKPSTTAPSTQPQPPPKKSLSATHSLLERFGAIETLEISRRLERGRGSNYRVNGVEASAREIQLLFADLSSGSLSNSIVSQGRIAELAESRPVERRYLLEEIAGIRGLHARRAEAERRLSQATENMALLAERIAALTERSQALASQAEFAARYRLLHRLSRGMKALRLESRRQHQSTQAHQADSLYEAARAQHQEQQQQVEALELACRKHGEALQASEEDMAAAQAAFRAQEAEHRHHSETIIALKQKLEGLLALQNELRASVQREQQRQHEFTTRLAGLGQEKSETNWQQIIDEANADIESCDGALKKRRVLLAQATEQRAQRQAQQEASRRQWQALKSDRQEADKQLEALQRQRDDVEREQARREQLREHDAEDNDARYDSALQARERATQQRQHAQEQAEQHRRVHQQADNERRAHLEEADFKLKKIETEIEALELVLGATPTLFSPLVDVIEAREGYELALSAALGEDLSASVDHSAPIHFTRLPPLSSEQRTLPDGVVPLAQFVTAPPALERCLSQIGLLEHAEQGDMLRRQLEPGQCLVSRSGAVWRWDGLTAQESAAQENSTRLQSRNRWNTLKAQRDRVAVENRELKNRIDKERATQKQLTMKIEAELERTTRAHEHAQQSLDEYQAQRETAHRSALAAVAMSSQLQERLDALNHRIEERQQAIVRIEQRQGMLEPGLGSPQAQDKEEDAEIDQLSAHLAELEARRERAALARHNAESARQHWRQRLEQQREQRQDWTRQQHRAEQAVQQFEDRLSKLEQEITPTRARHESLQQELENQVRAVEQKTRHLKERQEAHEKQQRAKTRADEQLVLSERRLRTHQDRLVRAETQHQHEQLRLVEIDRDIESNLQCGADQLARNNVQLRLEIEALPETFEPLLSCLKASDSESWQRAEDWLTTQLAELGEVNLRAELDKQNLDDELAGLESEKEDIEQAAARLQQAVATINDEAAERLKWAFDRLEEKAPRVFQQLFGGGQLSLALTNMSDPLNAGLEVIAKLPGKRLQSMALLSGGEKTLLSLTLLFAAFQANPSPFCVLDEADAPLDDVNVGKFCDFVEALATEERINFLVITHHRLTMSRVSRLLGVTMVERGISRVVSVDMGAKARRAA